MQRRAQRPLGGRRARAARGRCGEEAVHRQRQRILELAGDRQARAARRSARDRRAIQALQVSDLGGVRALARAPRRQVGLERHLDEHRAAGAGDLGEQRRGVGHVLEHVGEDAEVVGAVGDRQVQRRRRARPTSISGALARDRRRPPAVISTPDSRPPKPRRCSSQSSAPSPQPTSSVLAGRDARARAQRDHVVGLADRAERAPARVQGRVGGRLRVGVVVEADELGGVRHAGDYCGRDDEPSSRRRCARRRRRCPRWPRSCCSSSGRPTRRAIR